MLWGPFLAPLGIGYSFHVVYVWNFTDPSACNTVISLNLSRYRDDIGSRSPVILINLTCIESKERAEVPAAPNDKFVAELQVGGILLFDISTWNTRDHGSQVWSCVCVYNTPACY
jgi:hypothetical protein